MFGLFGGKKKQERGLEEEVESIPIKKLAEAQMSDRIRVLHEAEIDRIADYTGSADGFHKKLIEAGEYAESKGMYSRALELYENAGNKGRKEAIRIHLGLDNEERAIELYGEEMNKIIDEFNGSPGSFWKKLIEAGEYAERVTKNLSEKGRVTMLEKAADHYERAGDEGDELSLSHPDNPPLHPHHPRLPISQT